MCIGNSADAQMQEQGPFDLNFGAVNIGLGVASAFYGRRAIHRYTIRLAQELPNLSVDDTFTLFSWRFRKPLSTPALPGKGGNVRHSFWPIPGSLLMKLWEREWWPPVELFTGKLSIFHSLDYDLPTSRCKTAFTLHGVVHLTRPDTIAKNEAAWGQSILGRAARRCDVLLAVSQKTRDDYLSFYPSCEKRMFVTPLGIDSHFRPGPDDRDPAALRALGIRDPYILFVGEICAKKNVPGLLRAHAILCKTGLPDLQLVLAGDYGVGCELVRCQVRRATEQHNVLVTGWLPANGSELPALYRGASVFAFPSLDEGWTSPPLEAMACGCPVVTSNVSSLPETVGDAAIQVDPLDSEAIANAILCALVDTQTRSRLIQRGFQRAAQFSWKETARKTLEAYKLGLQ